mgnify:CR=1 FL=1
MVPTQLERDLTAVLAKHVYGKARIGSTDNAILKHPLLCALDKCELTPEQLDNIELYSPDESFLKNLLHLVKKSGTPPLHILQPNLLHF